MAKLQLENVQKVYDGNIIAINNFNLQVNEKEFIVLVGPSGCGKSTTLRMIAGLEKISSGNLYIDGKRMNDVKPQNRNIAMVFQNYALYPHMTVYDNLAFNLKLQKVSKNEIDKKVTNISETLSLSNLLHRKPNDLSGGQQQRVALGRAIIRNANIFLMDEPLSNLDAKLRHYMRTEIKKLHHKLDATTIYVTHDQTEAMTMATRLVVMKDGIVQQIGDPKTVYNYPENTFVGGFIGSPAMNFFTGTISDNHFIVGDYKFLIPRQQLSILKLNKYFNKNVIVGIRPEDIHLNVYENDKLNEVTVRTTFVELTGADKFVHSNLNDQKFITRINNEKQINNGELIKLYFNMDKAHFFDNVTKVRIR